MKFKVYDTLGYLNKPDLIAKGLSNIALQTWGSFFSSSDQSTWTEPDFAHIDGEYGAINKILKSHAKLATLDIEHWVTSGTDDDVIRASVEKLRNVIRHVKRATPGVDVGYYSIMPRREYWPPATADETTLATWYAVNDKAAKFGLADEVDVIFPSLYTFYDDPDGWVEYAVFNIAEARRYGKPVVPYIWPHYHNSNQTLGGALVAGDYWRRQLEIVHRHADGVALWGGWQVEWDENAPWWTETKTFLASL